MSKVGLATDIVQIINRQLLSFVRLRSAEG